MTKNWASASREKKKAGRGGLGSGSGRKAGAERGSPGAPHPRGSPGKYHPLLKAPGLGAVPLGSLVQGRESRSAGWLPRAGTGVGGDQMIRVSQWWRLRDCQSLAEHWSTWILGWSHRREGTTALPGVVPNIPKHPLPDAGLGAPQGKGCHDLRQCNSSRIERGEQR